MCFCTINLTNHEGFWKPMKVQESFWHVDETLWGSTDDAMCLFYVSCLHSSLNLGFGQVVDTKMYLLIKVPARTTLQDATKALLTRLFLLAKAHGISGISGTVWWIQCISGRGLRMMSHVPPCRRAAVPPCRSIFRFTRLSAATCAALALARPVSSDEIGIRINSVRQVHVTSYDNNFIFKFIYIFTMYHVCSTLVFIIGSVLWAVQGKIPLIGSLTLPPARGALTWTFCTSERAFSKRLARTSGLRKCVWTCIWYSLHESSWI